MITLTCWTAYHEIRKRTLTFLEARTRRNFFVSVRRPRFLARANFLEFSICVAQLHAFDSQDTVCRWQRHGWFDILYSMRDTNDVVDEATEESMFCRPAAAAQVTASSARLGGSVCSAAFAP